MKKYLIAFLLASFALVLPQAVGAHADGKSFEAKDAAGNSIDIGYSELPSAGASTIFDFSARDADKQVIPYDQIWVRMSKASSTYMATGLAKAPIGKTVLTYRFPEAGSYEMEVRFERGGESVVEHTFTLTAGADTDAVPETSIPMNMLLSIAAAFLAGGVLTYFFFPRTR